MPMSDNIPPIPDPQSVDGQSPNETAIQLVGAMVCSPMLARYHSGTVKQGIVVTFNHVTDLRWSPTFCVTGGGFGTRSSGRPTRRGLSRKIRQLVVPSQVSPSSNGRNRWGRCVILITANRPSRRGSNRPKPAHHSKLNTPVTSQRHLC